MIPSNRIVVDALIQGLGIATPQHLAESLEGLGGLLRASLQNTALYGNALDWIPVSGATSDDLAKHLHPFNIGAAIVAVCNAAPAFGYASVVLPPQDLHLYLNGAWQPLASLSAESSPITPPVAAAPPPPPVQAMPPPPPAAPAPPPPAPTAPVSDLAALAAGLTAAPVDLPPVTQTPDQLLNHLNSIPGRVPMDELPKGLQQPTTVVPFPQTPQQAPAAAEPEPEAAPALSAGGLPTADIGITGTGKAGRPYKSAFEKEHTPRKTIAKPPFWWEEMQNRWHLLLTQPPAMVVGNDSTGNAPLISYAAMVHTMQLALYNVPNDTSVGDIKAFLEAVRNNIGASQSAPVAFTLTEQLFAAK